MTAKSIMRLMTSLLVMSLTEMSEPKGGTGGGGWEEKVINASFT